MLDNDSPINASDQLMDTRVQNHDTVHSVAEGEYEFNTVADVIISEPGQLRPPGGTQGDPNKRSLIKATEYIDSHKYGEPARDDSDEEDKKYPELQGKTPNTRKRLIKEQDLAEVEKMGPLATGLTLFKSFNQLSCHGKL